MKSKFLAWVLGGTLLFSACAFSACGESDVQVYAPDGAPALALAKLLAEDRADDGVAYTITSADKITTFVTGNAPKADVCIMPVNQASKLLGDGSVYQMVGLATHGNMYLLSEEEGWYGVDNATDLHGKRMGVVQFANVPGLTLRAALSALGVSYSTQVSTQDNLYLQGITPAEVKAQGDFDLYLCPEPAASAKIKAFTAQGKPLYMVGDLQALYGIGGYPQACVMAKKTFIQNHPEKFAKITEGLVAVEGYLPTAEIAEICLSVSSHLEAGLAATFTAQNLTYEVVARSNVRFERSVDFRGRVDEFLQKIKTVSVDSASAVLDDFYYIEG